MKNLVFLSLFLFTVCVPCTINAQVKLPRLIRDSMVLQRDVKLNIWGWAKPGEKVTVQFNNKKYRATTARDSSWKIVLPAQNAGGPYTMNISASNRLTLKDILIGDVWVCSGQSNMVHQLSLHKDRYQKEIAEANHPQIRHFWIPAITELQGPKNDYPTGYWKSANPNDVLQFSVVAYFFAKEIHQRYGVPVGLINASVGGSPIEAWMSEEGLKEFPGISETIKRNKDTAFVNGIIRTAAANAVRPPAADKGLQNEKPWFDPDYIPKNWRTINVPGYWEDQGIKDLDGIVWYRREVDVPAQMAGKTARLSLGRIVDADIVFLNGKQVGQTTYMYPQRRYQVPAGALEAGKNIIVVRVTNNWGKGGFVPDKPYYLAADKDTIDLKGEWLYKVGQAFPPQRGGSPGFSAQNSPTALYNAMLVPATKMPVKGVLWYQGESNAGNPAQYRKLLPALIHDWRTQWQNKNLPFLSVQLPDFMEVAYHPTESNWALLREAQLESLKIPNTGMAVTLGLGEWNDIHPGRKKEIGQRLALLAQRIAYGDNNIVASGPLLESAVIEGSSVTINFKETGSGLVTCDGEEPGEFAIAGADKKFVWAKARIEGNKVIVWNDQVSAPMYVRYAWADNPDNPNLCNKEGLPASPFRTDN